MRKYILIYILLFFNTVVVFSQCELSSNAYEIMLSGLLSHSVEEICVEEIPQGTSYIFLDAREEREFQVSHIANASWVGYDDFTLDRVKKIRKEMPIVVYCSVGYRSEKITERLKEAGYKNIQNLYGGMFEWINAGREICDSQGVTKNVHAYNKSWGVWLHRGIKIYN